jgi:hypothetical protein
VPVRAEIFVEPDGAVVFADLAAELLPIAAALDFELTTEDIGPAEAGMQSDG